MNRIFNIIVELPLSEYIRKRRLTKAHYVLARKNCNWSRTSFTNEIQKGII